MVYTKYLVVSALILLFSFFILSNTHNRLTSSSGLSPNPSVIYSNDYTPLITTSSVERFENLNIGVVTAKLQGHDMEIPVIITPYREILVGSEINHVVISYNSHAFMPIQIVIEDIQYY